MRRLFALILGLVAFLLLVRPAMAGGTGTNEGALITSADEARVIALWPQTALGP